MLHIALRPPGSGNRHVVIDRNKKRYFYRVFSRLATRFVRISKLAVVPRRGAARTGPTAAPDRPGSSPKVGNFRAAGNPAGGLKKTIKRRGRIRAGRPERAEKTSSDPRGRGPKSCLILSLRPQGPEPRKNHQRKQGSGTPETGRATGGPKKPWVDPGIRAGKPGNFRPGRAGKAPAEKTTKGQRAREAKNRPGSPGGCSKTGRRRKDHGSARRKINSERTQECAEAGTRKRP